MKRILAIAFLMLAALTAGIPANASAYHPDYRLWRTVVHEPGTLGLTFRDHVDVYDVFAVAASADENYVTMSPIVRQRGHLFTLILRFPKGSKTGDWYLVGVYATTVGHEPDPFAGPVTDEVTKFEVRSR